MRSYTNWDKYKDICECKPKQKLLKDLGAEERELDQNIYQTKYEGEWVNETLIDSHSEEDMN